MLGNGVAGEVSIDWPALEDRAAPAQASPHAAIALQLATDLLGAKVPAPRLHALRRASPDGLPLELARERMLEEKGATREAAELLLRWQRRGFRDRLATLKSALVPDTFSRPDSSGSGIVSRLSSYPAHIGSLLRRYLPMIGALARHPTAVGGIARREANKSPLDA